MTDLLQALPDFDTAPYTHLLPSLDKALISVADLVTLEPAQVAKRAQLPPGDVRKLIEAIVSALHQHLGFGGEERPGSSFRSALRSLPAVDDCQCPDGCISTLDEKLDAALGGGIPPGYLVEVAGESGVGKTQLLLTLLLASQLPHPRGLAKSAIYISTEAALATNRLAQLLASHPALALASLPSEHRPSLSRILSIQTPDLESQEHILRYQLPVAIKKHRVGLVVLDSVAANYRAEFDKKGDRDGAASMARRSAQLVQLGALLRNLARTEGIAVVVANQVADRFTTPSYSLSSNANAISRTPSVQSQGTTTSSATERERENTPHAFNPLPSDPPSQRERGIMLSQEPLTLDHQQRWFTGWGDNPSEPPHTLKTPSLGLVWTNQIACRIALIKQPVFASRPPVINVNGEDQWNDGDSHISKWRRWFKVVFAPWAAPSEGRGVEFEILKTGVRHVGNDK